MLFWKLSYERTFCWSRHVRGCCAENRLMVVSGSFLVKGHVMFCWGRHLRGYVIFEKSINITQQTVDNAFNIGSPCNSLLVFVGLWWCWSLLMTPLRWFFADFCLSWLRRDKCTKGLLVIFQLLLAASVDLCQSAEPCGFFWIEQLLLIHVWCLASELDC